MCRTMRLNVLGGAICALAATLLVPGSVLAQQNQVKGRMKLCVSSMGEVKVAGVLGPGVLLNCPVGWRELPWPAQGAMGPVGPRGAEGPPGPPGIPGNLKCWDLNGNGVPDPTEDRSGDGIWDALDCQGPPGATGAMGVAGPPITTCEERRFPAEITTLSEGQSVGATCPATYVAVSALCAPTNPYLIVQYPNTQSAACKCNLAGSGLQCQINANVAVVRCCK